MKISATVVTLNEERNIGRCLQSLKGVVDEIVIVDSGSEDHTRETAAAAGARVITETWRGYAAQKNYAATCASNDWILSLNADEALSPELAAEIKTLRQGHPSPQPDAYSMPRLAHYLGKWIRHSGWYPDRKVRLYRRDRAAWTGDYVHESVTIRGQIGQLQNDLLHFTCDSLEQHRRTLERYTSLAASELHSRKMRIPLSRVVINPAWTFLKSYVFQLGFLDGPAGFTIARMAALYTFLKYSKARELATH